MQRASCLVQNVNVVIKARELGSSHSLIAKVHFLSRGIHSTIEPAATARSEPPSDQFRSPRVQLRPYQEESITSVLEYLSKGEKRLGVSLATGSGKTVIFSHLVSRVPPPTALATQSLILAHRRELVEQAARHCRALYPDLVVEVDMGAVHASGRADITVASVQSLTSGDGTRLRRYDPARLKLLLVDEAHHIVAPRYLDVLRHFRLEGEGEKGPAALVGFSATFSRLDGLRLGAAIDHIVYHKDYVAMIEDKWLSSAVFTTVQSRVDLSKVKTSHGDFATGSLSEAMNNDETNTITVRSWLEKAAKRRSTLVFCVDLAHVASLTAAFRQHGIDAQFITSDTHVKVRAERLEAFKAGKFPVLLNCGLFTEGTDIPNVDCIVLARPTQSQNLLVQMIGRGLRKHPGKENCHIIDMVASLETGIVTTPTLFGLDPQTIIEHATTSDMKDRRERIEMEGRREFEANDSRPHAGASGELKSNVTFTDYDTVHDLIEDTSGERHIRAVSRFGWVQIDDERYMLSNRDGGYLTLKRDGEMHVVFYTRKLPVSATSKQAPYARPVQVADGISFTAAVNAADKFASEMFPFEFISKTAAWRKGPASSGQVAFLNKFRGEGDKLKEGSITKGRAADWITKMRHGARGRFNRVSQQQRKVEKLANKKERWSDRQRKSTIDVGPVEW